MSTYEAKKKNENEVKAIISGDFDLGAVSYTFRRRPFVFYIKRFVAQKMIAEDVSDEIIDGITFTQTKEYIEKIIDNYPKESREKLRSLYSERFKRDLRKAFTYEDDCKANRCAMDRIAEVPQDFADYKKISKKKEKTIEEKSRMKEIKDRYGFAEKRRFTRTRLLELFFLFDCNLYEAEELFHRLGEQSFYAKDRKEMLVWWSLQQQTDKYGKYLELVRKGILEAKQRELNYSNMSTGNFYKKFYECKTDYDFENVVVQLSENIRDGRNYLASDSVRELYFNIIKKIDEIFNTYFRTAASDRRIRKWNEEIAEYSEQLFVEGITKKKQTSAYKAIEARDEKKSKEKIRLHKVITTKPGVSVLNTRLSEFMESEDLDSLGEMVRIKQIRKNPNAEICREDIIIAFFIKTVLENYYDKAVFEAFEKDTENSSKDAANKNKKKVLDGALLFDSRMIETLEDYEVLDIISKYENDLNGYLWKYDFMELNYLNEFEAYLVLCLASGNPLKYFCRIVSTFEMFDYE